MPILICFDFGAIGTIRFLEARFIGSHILFRLDFIFMRPFWGNYYYSLDIISESKFLDIISRGKRFIPKPNARDNFSVVGTLN